MIKNYVLLIMVLAAYVSCSASENCTLKFEFTKISKFCQTKIIVTVVEKLAKGIEEGEVLFIKEEFLLIDSKKGIFQMVNKFDCSKIEKDKEYTFRLKIENSPEIIYSEYFVLNINALTSFALDDDKNLVLSGCKDIKRDETPRVPEKIIPEPTDPDFLPPNKEEQVLDNPIYWVISKINGDSILMNDCIPSNKKSILKIIYEKSVLNRKLYKWTSFNLENLKNTKGLEVFINKDDEDEENIYSVIAKLYIDDKNLNFFIDDNFSDFQATLKLKKNNSTEFDKLCTVGISKIKIDKKKNKKYRIFQFPLEKEGIELKDSDCIKVDILFKRHNSDDFFKIRVNEVPKGVNCPY